MRRIHREEPSPQSPSTADTPLERSPLDVAARTAPGLGQFFERGVDWRADVASAITIRNVERRWKSGSNSPKISATRGTAVAGCCGRVSAITSPAGAMNPYPD